MKKVLSMILLAGVFAGPVLSAEGTASGAASVAASGASIDKVSLAVYEAVKAQPDKAADIFQSVISQRASWSVTDTYAVLRSVLLASPSLEGAFVQSATMYQTGGYNVATMNSTACQLLNALYTMPQTQAVAGSVVQGVVGSAVAGRAAGNGVSQSVVDSYVPVAPSAPQAPEYTVIPTPPPTSSNN